MTIAIIAPHPDDETLGCGGTLLRHRAEGAALHWVIMSTMSPQSGYTHAQIEARQAEIEVVRAAYGFETVTCLGYPPAGLDEIPLRRIVADLSQALANIAPETLYLPFTGDAHSDHRITFDAAIASTKWFRAKNLRSVLSYETLSETGILGGHPLPFFMPNLFVDISAHLDRKIEIMRTYKSEMAPFPHPRSEEAIRALAMVRGATSGYTAAESFMLIKGTR